MKPFWASVALAAAFFSLLLPCDEASARPRSSVRFSAVRRPGEDASIPIVEAWLRATRGSAVSQAVAFDSLDYSAVPTIASEALADARFREVRDPRFLNWTQDASFPRRITWLYPQDGCYLRAHLMANLWLSQAESAPAQVFIFGNFDFPTEFGQAYWWYHVAPAFQAQGQVYIIDPSLDFKKPLALEDWALKITGGDLSAATFSICHTYATWPDADCGQDEPDFPNGESAMGSSIQDFLGLEWQNVWNLGRDPAALLGDSPPWLARAPI